MKKPLSDIDEVIDLERDPEVKSFIYQMINEFSGYVTPTTVAAVVSKDPLKANSVLLGEHSEVNKKNLGDMLRIAVTLSDQGAHITEEALAENVFDALKLAKEKMVKRLDLLHNEITSKQERFVQLEAAKKSTLIH
jgi:hypothetical protein